MKINKKLFALSATFVIAAQFGTTAMAANADGDASVTVIEPLTITAVDELNFGTIAAGSAPGTVDMSATGALTVLTGGPELQALDANGTLGTFTISGEDNQITVVTLPATVALTGAGADMSVALDSNAGATTALNASGDFDMEVFGVLAVGANQAAGDYTGTYNVTVFYQ